MFGFTQVARAEVVVDVDTSPLKKGLSNAEIMTKRSGDSMHRSLSSKFGGIRTSAFALAGGITAAVGALGYFVKSAAESQAVAAQVEAVIKSTGGAAGVTAQEVDKLATSLALKSGVDDEAIASGQAVLLTFTNVRNEVGAGNDIFNQATKTILDMSVALGTDLQSANIQVGKALNDPIKGITALTRVGVTFDEQTKKQIKTLVESGKTMEAQKIILAELRREFGGSAEAAGNTFNGKINILKVSLGNLAETIGQQLLPYVTK